MTFEAPVRFEIQEATDVNGETWWVYDFMPYLDSAVGWPDDCVPDIPTFTMYPQTGRVSELRYLASRAVASLRSVHKARFAPSWAVTALRSEYEMRNGKVERLPSPTPIPDADLQAERDLLDECVRFTILALQHERDYNAGVCEGDTLRAAWANVEAAHEALAEWRLDRDAERGNAVPTWEALGLPDDVDEVTRGGVTWTRDGVWHRPRMVQVIGEVTGDGSGHPLPDLVSPVSGVCAIVPAEYDNLRHDPEWAFENDVHDNFGDGPGPRCGHG